MTAGTSVSEKACDSRRKWTSMTLMSASAKPAATTHHGIWNGTASGASSRIRRPYRMVASTARDAEKVQTRTAGVSERPRFIRKRSGAC